GTRALGRIASLESLNVQSTELARDKDETPPRRPWPDGLADLAGLKNLRSLDLGSNSGANDQGLKLLASLPQLQTLALSRTRVRDTGVASLAAFKKLETLDLGITKITDAAVGELAKLSQLRGLNVSYAKVTDAGLKKLAALRQLRSLDIAGIELTDAG